MLQNYKLYRRITGMLNMKDSTIQSVSPPLWTILKIAFDIRGCHSDPTLLVEIKTN